MKMIGNVQAVSLIQVADSAGSTVQGKRAVVLPTGCARSEGLLAGICRTKFKVPAIPRSWGPC